MSPPQWSNDVAGRQRASEYGYRRWPTPGLLAALLGIAAACLGTFFAFVAWLAVCGDGTSNACLEGHPVDWRLIGHVLAAVIGLVAAVISLDRAGRGRWRAAGTALVIALTAYALAAWWLDAAVHAPAPPA